MTDYLSRIENGEDGVEGDDDFPYIGILRISASEPETDKSSPYDKCLEDMSHFLSTGLPPPRIGTDKKKCLAVRSHNFCLLEGTLYHKGHDGIWRRCVRNYEKEAVLREAHCGIAGGHYAGDTNV